MEAVKDLVENTFIFSRMLIDGCLIIFVEIYIYFRVKHSLESCHRLYFSIEGSYVYYEFVRFYLYRVIFKEVYGLFIRTFTQL